VGGWSLTALGLIAARRMRRGSAKAGTSRR
jgi:hypothetical protein